LKPEICLLLGLLRLTQGAGRLLQLIQWSCKSSMNLSI